jgi:hypothetical protein
VDVVAKTAEVWHALTVTSAYESRTWLTIPDVAAVLEIGVSRVHSLLENQQLLAVRRDGVLQVPADFIVEGYPMNELRGTLIVLADDGFSDAEAMHWLLEAEESLGVAPIDALRAGRKAEVRRIAQALA